MNRAAYCCHVFTYLFVYWAGFSRQIVQIFKDHSVQYSSFDILSDEEVRQGLKTYSNWPTYPQVYANGELVGGLDIIKVRPLLFKCKELLKCGVDHTLVKLLRHRYDLFGTANHLWSNFTSRHLYLASSFMLHSGFPQSWRTWKSHGILRAHFGNVRECSKLKKFHMS